MMSSAICAVNFAFADGTAKIFSLGTFNANADAVTYFKDRLRKFDTVDKTSGKKFTN